MNIYFAGEPCVPGDWRHKLVHNLEISPTYFRFEPDAPWPSLHKSIAHAHHYVGPYPMGHMPSDAQRRWSLLSAMAIAQADLVFCWADGTTASETAAFELGYAAGLRKYVVAGSPDGDVPLLVHQVADEVLDEPDLGSALTAALFRAAAHEEEQVPYRAILSKFEGRCLDCGDLVKKSTLAMWRKDEGAYHLSCFARRKPLARTVVGTLQSEVMSVLQEENSRLRGELEKAWQSSERPSKS